LRKTVKLARSVDWGTPTLAAAANRARIGVTHRSKKALVASRGACPRTKAGTRHKAALLRPVRGAHRIGEDELF
jgi:hypothetical protein